MGILKCCFADVSSSGLAEMDDELKRLDGIVRDIQGLGLTSPIQTEVVRQLLRGRATISELTQIIFGVEPASQEFHPYYVRTWRAVRELEARGLVSAPLLGKDKAHRVTKHGLGVLLKISEKPARVYRRMVTRWDATLFASTILAGTLSYLLARPSSVLTPLFIFLLGASTCKMLTRLGEVW